MKSLSIKYEINYVILCAYLTMEKLVFFGGIKYQWILMNQMKYRNQLLIVWLRTIDGWADKVRIKIGFLAHPSNHKKFKKLIKIVVD